MSNFNHNQKKEKRTSRNMFVKFLLAKWIWIFANFYGKANQNNENAEMLSI
jgi:hypothetical protein